MPAPQLVGAAKNSESRLLDGIAPPDLKVILAAGKRRQYVSNSVVANQGNPADHLYLLTEGRARFFFNTPDGKKVNLLWLTPGEIFGESALLSNASRYLVSAETLKDSTMLVWDRGTLRKDRKSTRLNSSHGYISYAVFCLKKKKYSNNETSCVHSTTIY